MDDEKRDRLTKALIESEVRREYRASREAELKKEEVRSKAKQVIYDHITNWVGRTISPGEKIPVVRNGKEVGEFHGAGLAMFLDSSDPVDRVLDAAEKQISPKQLKAKLSRLQKAEQNARKFIASFQEFTSTEWALIGCRGADELPSELKARTEYRVLEAVHYSVAAPISVQVLCEGIKKEISDLQQALDSFPKKPGRRRDEKRYQVALGLAKLYARITGNRPTYSQNENGLHGEYSPALGDLFACYRWTSIKSQAEYARDCITEEDFEYPKMYPMGSILALPPNSQE